MTLNGMKTLLFVLTISLGVLGCSSKSGEELPTASISGESTSQPAPEQASTEGDSTTPMETAPNPPVVSNVFREDLADDQQPEPYPEVVIRTTLGDIKLKLDAEKAPETVDNFLRNYVDRDFYSNTIFHFVDPEFVVMAGGYTPELQRAEPRTPIRNEAHNGLKNVRGKIAMSRHPDYTASATCEFFINVKDNTSLDHTGTEDSTSYGYCVFGEVIDGLDVVDRIAGVPVKSEAEFDQLPVESIVIKAIERIK